jgi:hypothetical protein
MGSFAVSGFAAANLCYSEEISGKQCQFGGVRHASNAGEVASTCQRKQVRILLRCNILTYLFVTMPVCGF